MRKIILSCIMMFLFVGFVYADEDRPDLEFVNSNHNSVTLRVNANKDDVCYIYRSLNNVDYDDKIIVDCNKMYTDNNVVENSIYYYKASVNNSDLFSEIIMVDTEQNIELDEYNNEYKPVVNNRDPFAGIIVFIFTIILFLILLTVLVLLSKRYYVKGDKKKIGSKKK